MGNQVKPPSGGSLATRPPSPTDPRILLGWLPYPKSDAQRLDEIEAKLDEVLANQRRLILNDELRRLGVDPDKLHV